MITSDYEVKAGYGFYEFVDPEYIGRNKRVILIDKVCLSSSPKGADSAMFAVC